MLIFIYMVCFVCQLAADGQLFYVFIRKVDCTDLTECKAFNIRVICS